MKRTNYRVIPLPTAVANEARRQLAVGASDHSLVTTEAPGVYPCRHCLQWAQPGEPVVLFPYASIASDRPYAESGPVFVHAERCERYAAAGVYPEDFRGQRVVRAYNGSDEMIDAIVSDEPEATAEQLFGNSEVDFLQVRSATRGCYTFRMERA